MNYKRKATVTLTLVAVLFIFASVLKYFYNNITFVRLLFFATEAALIGGMADWFAVTAIFREPLGFSFHTAIIPKNRIKIVESIVNIVQKEFLSAQLIGNRLEKVNITDKVIKLLDSDSGRESVRNLLVKLIKANIEGDGGKNISRIINNILKSSFRSVNINNYVNNLFELSIKNGDYKKIMMFLIDDIIKVAEGPGVRDKIYSVLNEIKAEKTQGLLGVFFNKTLEDTNIINIGELADSIHMHLIETVYNLKNEEHPTTQYIMGVIEEHLLMNARNPFDANGTDNIKNGIIDGLINDKMVVNILQNIRKSIDKIENDTVPVLANDDENDIVYLIMSQINLCWESLKNNHEMMDNIEKIIKQSIYNFIDREHDIIGKIVKDTLDSFSDDELNKFIEDRAGNDLQWIRINGSIVGGFVGILVFIFLNCFYDPIAVPIIRSWFM